MVLYVHTVECRTEGARRKDDGQSYVVVSYSFSTTDHGYLGGDDPAAEELAALLVDPFK